jgi:hypothetical protein
MFDHLGLRGAGLSARQLWRLGREAFFEAALASGRKDNGPPGLRPNYHPIYDGAFVIDPDGHNMEAVRHSPEA